MLRTLITWLIFVAQVALPASGLGTVFGPSNIDPLGNPNDKLGCTGKHLRMTDKVVAHKTLSCGTHLLVCVPRNGRCAETIVADWGPVHAAIDLSIGLARKLHHNGKEVVTWTVLP